MVSRLEKHPSPVFPPRIVVPKNVLTPTAIDWINLQIVRTRGSVLEFSWPHAQGPLISSLEFGKLFTKSLEASAGKSFVSRNRASLWDIFSAICQIQKDPVPQIGLQKLRSQISFAPLGLIFCDPKQVVEEIENLSKTFSDDTNLSADSETLLLHFQLRAFLAQKRLRFSDWEWLETALSQNSNHAETPIKKLITEGHYCVLGDLTKLESLEEKLFSSLGMTCLNHPLVKPESHFWNSERSSPIFWGLEANMRGPLGLRPFLPKEIQLPLPTDLSAFVAKDPNFVSITQRLRSVSRTLTTSNFLSNLEQEFPNLEGVWALIKNNKWGLDDFGGPGGFVNWALELELVREEPTQSNLEIPSVFQERGFSPSAPPILPFRDFLYFPNSKNPKVLAEFDAPSKFFEKGATGPGWPRSADLQNPKSWDVLISLGIRQPDLSQFCVELETYFKSWSFTALAPQRSRDSFTDKEMSAEGSPVRNLAILADEKIKPQTLSPSSIEALLKCPLQFALERRLKLSPHQPEDPHSLDPLGTGNWIHSSLEALYKDATPSDLRNPRFFYDSLVPILGNTLETSFDPKPSDSYIKILSAHIPGLATKLSQMLSLLEENLEAKGASRSKIQLEQGFKCEWMGLNFTGKIDRIDFLKNTGSESKGFLFDYKTGSPPSEKPLTQIQNKKLQWFLYRSLFEHSHSGMTLAGGGYLQPLRPHASTLFVFESKDESGTFRKIFEDLGKSWDCNTYLINPETEKEILLALEKTLHETRKTLESSHFLPLPLKPMVCQACRVKRLCGLPLLNPDFPKGLVNRALGEIP